MKDLILNTDTVLHNWCFYFLQDSKLMKHILSLNSFAFERLSLVQFIFDFLSAEVSENILKLPCII